MSREPESRPACIDCRFFGGTSREGVNGPFNRGLCRIHPPRLPTQFPDTAVASHKWPLVNATDWCGAFERKGETP